MFKNSNRTNAKKSIEIQHGKNPESQKDRENIDSRKKSKNINDVSLIRLK